VTERPLGLASVPPTLVLHPRTLARLRAAEAELRALVRPEVAEAVDREVVEFVTGRRP
jgi:hypothetical protein